MSTFKTFRNVSLPQIFLCLVLVFNLFKIRPLAAQSATKDEKIILIDTDAGTDDAWAILLAVANLKVNSAKIVGITTTCGNADVKNVTNNVARTLQVTDENRIPIFEGMSEFITGPYKHVDEPPFNGEDGFGDQNLPPIKPPKIEKEHAVNAIIRLAEEYEGRLIIVTMGPLTNLAMAVKLKPEIKRQLKGVYIIGGNINALGNARPAAEFNFFADPEAAAITIDSFSHGPCPVTILPWETSLLQAASPYEFRTETIGKIKSPQMELMNAIEAPALARVTDVWIPPDALILACALNPDIILETENHPAAVELSGARTRGMLVVDKRVEEGSQANLKFITKVNKTMFQSLMVWAAMGPSTASKI